jgi:hypothetical protein
MYSKIEFLAEKNEGRLEGVDRRNLKIYKLKHTLQVGVSVRIKS